VFVQTKREGVEPVGTLCGQEEINFSQFCADIAYGWTLTRNGMNDFVYTKLNKEYLKPTPKVKSGPFQ